MVRIIKFLQFNTPACIENDATLYAEVNEPEKLVIKRVRMQSGTYPIVEFADSIQMTDYHGEHINNNNAYRCRWYFSDTTGMIFNNGIKILTKHYDADTMFDFLNSLINGKQPDFSILGIDIDLGERAPEADDIMDPIF